MKNIQIFFLFIIFFSTLHSQTLEKITLQLQWKHQFEFAGFYMAKEKGYYQDKGLDVEFIEFEKNIDIVGEVLKGKADYGLSYSSIILDYMNNSPIVFVANFFKQSPLVLVTQKNITSPSELKGAKIEGLANNIHNITLYAMLNKFDIHPEDIDTVLPTFGIEAFINKEVDAMSLFTTNEIFLLDEAGVEYNVFDPISYAAKYYDANLFTSKEEATNNPQRVKDFKEASVKGWEYALSHKEESIKLILEKYNTQNKSKKALLFEAKQVEQIILPKVHEIGSIDVERVKIIAENFVQSNFSKKFDTTYMEKFIFDEGVIHNNLTKEEKNYLAQKKALTICIDPNWMPIEAVKNNEHVGIAADYWKLFEKNLGVKLEVFQTQSWSDSLESMQKGNCDALSLSAPTLKRRKHIAFTDSFLSLSFVVVTQVDKKSVIDFSLLDGISIAVVKGYALIESIQTKYPKINVIEVANIEEGLNKVTDGEVFGFADSAVAIDYAYKNGSYSDFKVSAHFDEKLKLGLGVAKENVQLHTILQKIVRSIEYEQKQAILKKWFASKYEKKFDSFLFLQLSVFVGIILLLLAYRQYSIKKLNDKLQRRIQEEVEKSEEKNRVLFHQSKLVSMGEMLENIAHQWRQPLSQVNSCVLVIDDILDEKKIQNKEIEDKLYEIEFLTKYMSNTINDFKNFFDKNKVKENVALEKVVHKSLEIVKGRLDGASIKVRKDFILEHSSHTHANELQQVILVILNNAIDVLSLKKRVNPEVLIEIIKDESYNYIRICDNAGELQEQDSHKIFEPYFTTKYKSQGTGLGLYISKLIIEDSLGGELRVRSTKASTCFTIKLEVNKKV